MGGTDAHSVTCMLGTTRCLESSVLLSMRLPQSSRSRVLWEKARQHADTRPHHGPKPAPSLQEHPQTLPHRTCFSAQF